MTLIEIMIVIGVIAMMVGMIVAGFGAGRNAQTSRSVNQLANTLRYGYDKARVTGGYYRVLIDLDKSTVTLQAGDGRMYMPATDRNGEIVQFDESKAEDRAARDLRAEESYNRSIQSQVYEDGDADAEVSELDAYKPAPKKVPRRNAPLFDSFEQENALPDLVKPVQFPEGVKIIYVRTNDDFTPFTEGEASIYFFPGGRTQLAHIQLEDESGENKYTIKLQPLTGRVTIVDGLEDLVLPNDPGDEEDELGRRQEERTF
jgi:general secretion pathway protein H